MHVDDWFDGTETMTTTGGSSEDDTTGSNSNNDRSDKEEAIAEFRNLVLTLASSRPDVLSPKNRTALIQSAQNFLVASSTAAAKATEQGGSKDKDGQLVVDDDDDDDDGDDDDQVENDEPVLSRAEAREILANWKDLKCSSIHAHRRIVSLYTLGIQGLKDDDIDENDAITVLKSLCLALTSLLRQANDPALVEQCRMDLVEMTTSTSGTTNNQRAVALRDILYDIAKTMNTERTITAVALGSALAGSVNDNSSSVDENSWLNVLVQHATTHFTSSSEMLLATPFLTFPSVVTTKSWQQVIRPALLLKIKSHPDKALDTVLGFLLATTTGVLGKVVNARQELLESTDSSNSSAENNEWIAMMIKHGILSKNADNIETTRRIVLAWAQQLITDAAAATPDTKNAGDDFSTIVEVLTQVAAALVQAPGAVAQGPTRAAVYDILELLGAVLVKAWQTNQQQQQTMDWTTAEGTAFTSSLSKVLQGLVQLLGKETAPKAVDHRGLRAVVEWMILAKRGKQEDSDGYKAVLQLLTKAVASLKSPEAGPVLQVLISCVHADLLESIVVDLWSSNSEATTSSAKSKTASSASSSSSASAWQKGMEGWVEMATTKKSAQVEGLLCVYLTLLYADRSNTKLASFATKVLVAGKSTKLSSSSFLYMESMTDAIASNPLISTVLSRTIALYTQLASKRRQDNADASLASLFPAKSTSAAAQAMAACAIDPTSTRDEFASTSILSSLEVCLTYEPEAVQGLVEALLAKVNETALIFETSKKGQNATREAREATTTPLSATVCKGQGSENASHRGYDPSAVRLVARVLLKRKTIGCHPTTLAHALILVHLGSSLRSEGHQREALVFNTIHLIKEVLLPCEAEHAQPTLCSLLADEISLLVASAKKGSPLSLFDGKNNETDEPGDLISDSVHEATLSLLTSLGGIASNFSADSDDPEDDDMKPYVFASKLCIENIATHLSTMLEECLVSIEKLTEKDVGLFLSPAGVPFKAEDNAGMVEKKVGGKRLTEEEEWELQIKKELAEKKKKENASTVGDVMSAEDRALVEEQALERQRIGSLLHGDFCRVLDSIRQICLSDIEVGNQCLPVFGKIVLMAAVSTCPALRLVRSLPQRSSLVLTSLVATVYEIDDVHSPTLAQALLISCRQEQNEDNDDDNPPQPSKESSKRDLIVSPLPSPCAAAACAINEMDKFQDALSGPSFAFLFPVIQAALMGPRSPPGCEAALRILNRHTGLLSGESFNPYVGALRKDMAIAVLELLKHDRSQTFQNPTALEVLQECYQTEVDESGSAKGTLTAAELSPLLDDRGALGSKNCRIGAMLALGSVASASRKMLKNNPLVENRIWLSCFDSNEDIRAHARQTWIVLQDTGAVDDASLPPPSPLYAAPLLPLLSSPDKAIASAAASAMAHGMGLHPSSVGRNVENLCKAYIDSCPSAVTSDGQNGTGSKNPLQSASKKVIPVPIAPKKKAISTGLPKKKGGTKSALSVAGIGKPKTAKKATPSAATLAMLKPKQERTLDQEALEGQFLGVTTKTEDDTDSPSKVATRLGVLRALHATTNSTVKVDMEETTLKQVTSFLIAYGIADSVDEVKGAARDTLRDIVASKGGTDEAISFLLPLLETVLKSGLADESSMGSLPTDKVPREVSASDRRKEGAVVALGSVALHLKGSENESKIDSTIDMLISTLKTPSEDVQSSVADALTKLMKKGSTQERIETILTNLVRDCLHGESLAVRRGAAFGLSAAVKGSGIATLKKFEIVKQLEEACESGGSNNKEGSLFAIELLSERLGLLFEPYVIVLLPSLLKSFSDGADFVRKAASHTAELIMSKLSAHGVKLVMPAVLAAFDDPAWRTKQASINMLGAMSHLAPKQLASALPKVVPQLTSAFSDTHPKVKASAEEALEEISEVIRNPEIKSISSALLKALTDPADNTQKALESLIETEFLHAIDAPSLALIVPILHRGLRDRGATVKRMGGLIAGNICTMINDPKDFLPYIPILMPDLQMCLLDPIPDVRSTAGKALGSLTRSLGDQILPELRPWLIMKLRDETCSSAERSGAAQGLTEVLIASGAAMVDDAMRNEILPLRNYPEPGTREGVLWMLTFLPPALGQGFTPLIDVSLPALVSGLSDDSEPVRDVAMRAGRVLIRSHGKVHVDKILPSLEAGLNDDDYRIRLASLTLLGDLLSMIGGTQVIKGDGDTQEDLRRAERAQAQIALALGPETRKRVLSGVYLARSDSMHIVRQSAIQVWKTVVSVTARTLREILPFLVATIIDNLASGHDERTAMSGQCLGDIVTKLGDSVLPQIIPVLRNALYDGDEHTKRGVCVGLTEVIQVCTRDQITKFIEIIVKVVQDALSDEDENVRKMAAASFQSLHAVVGNRAFDEVVPSLMVALEADEDESSRLRALNGLTGILSVRSRELLPYIIPRLIQRPITANHAKALAGIAAVTGDQIHYHFGTIIQAIIFDLADLVADDQERETAIRDCARSICASISEPAGVNALVGDIASKCGSDKAPIRRESCLFLQVLITERAQQQDFYDQIPVMIRELVYRLNDDDPAVLKAANAAFTALSNLVSAEELVKHVEFMRNLLASMVSEARRRKGGVGDGEFLLPGFNIPKGLDPLLPIYQRGILYGSPTIREVSAYGLGEVLNLTGTKFLAGPMIVKMTGPLLRIVGDRNPSNVKVGILKTLGLILVKGGPALRAFVPQFQTTFVKALSDPSRQVRVEAVHALSLLMPLSTRVDPLIKELVTGSLGKNSAVEGLAAAAVQTATLDALATVLDKGGTKAKLPTSIPSALDAAKDLLAGPDQGIRQAAAKVMGAACSLSGPDMTLDILRGVVLAASSDESSNIRHGKACAVRYILAATVGAEISSIIPDLKRLIKMYLNDDKSLVREAACIAIGAVCARGADPKASLRESEGDLLKILKDTRESMDIHRAMACGFGVALQLIDRENRVDFMGVTMLDSCLQLALNSAQRVQLAYNDVLWLALDVDSGSTAGLDRYVGMTAFDNQRAIKSLHSKVLARIKSPSQLEVL